MKFESAKMPNPNEAGKVPYELRKMLQTLVRERAMAEKNQINTGNKLSRNADTIEDEIKQLLKDNPKHADDLDEEWTKMEEALA